MFRREVKSINDLLNMFLRHEGLETPLLQKRATDAWDNLMGEMITRYTGEKFIKNQTLYVKIINPALRQDLSMMKTRIVQRINQAVGSQVITDVKVY